MADQPQIKYVFFDLAEVLIQGLLNISPFMSTVLSVEPETVLPGLRKHLNEYMMGQMSENEFWARTLADNEWQADIKVLKAIVRKQLEPQIPGTVEVVRLVAADHHVYLHSDISREWMEYILKIHRFMDIFQRRFCSYELGVLKRDLTSFARTTQEIGARPEQCLFIDDYHRNLRVAETVGLQVIQFINATQLRENLMEIGVIK